MAPLSCASVTDLYGDNFGMSPEQIVKQTLKENELCSNKNLKYQGYLKENEIAGSFQPKIGNNNNNNNASVEQQKNKLLDNDVKFAKRLALTDIDNNWPTNQGDSMFNRFQHLFKLRENFGTPKSDSDCLRQLLSFVTELLLVVKIIMLVIILLFIIKILEKKN